MNRRGLMKGLMALGAVFALPRLAFGSNVDYRTDVYLKRGEVITNKTFANRVTFHNGYESVIANNTFENDVAVCNAHRSIFKNNTMKGTPTVAQMDTRYKDGRAVIWEKTPEGVRWRYAT